MGKFYRKLAALSVVTLLISVVVFSSVFFGIRGIYADNYQKGFVYQYRALQKADQNKPKIIVLGGSYMTFAVDSRQLGEESGMPAYTLGIHSGMGMCYILETAEKFIGKGDIVIMPFFPFTENDYGMDLIFVSMDSEPDLFFDFFRQHPLQVIKSSGAAAYTKLYGLLYSLQRYIRHKEDGSASVVYNAGAFDPDTGNLIYERTGCIAGEQDLYIKKVYEINDIDTNCYNELNEFAEFCKGKGASFYLTHAPIFEGAVISSDEEINLYQEELEERLPVPFLSDLREVLMPLEYIYNGAMHMNDAGKRYYTHKLYEDLSKYIDFSKE